MDNASLNVQSVSLFGTGMDFSVSVSSGSVTLNAGQPANFKLAVSPDRGFSQQVSLSCSGAPTDSVCSITPAQVTLNGSTASSVSVSITTTARAVNLPGFPSIPPGSALRLFLALVSIVLLLHLSARRTKRFAMGFSAALLVAGVGGGCAGVVGSGSKQPTGTPAGNYSLTLTGSSGNLAHSATFLMTAN